MYCLNDLAMMTGLHTRTLRNYIKRGVLHGSKRGGKWQFSEEAYHAFLENTAVRRSLHARRKGDVQDFLKEKARANRICFILDCPVPERSGAKTAEFFAGRVHDADVRFTYEQTGGVSRVILIGAEKQISEIITAYYRETTGGADHDA